jgi:hypothetical protein
VAATGGVAAGGAVPGRRIRRELLASAGGEGRRSEVGAGRPALGFGGLWRIHPDRAGVGVRGRRPSAQRVRSGDAGAWV